MKGTYRRQVDTNNASKSALDGIRACARGCMCAEVSIAGRRDSSPELAQSCWHPTSVLPSSFGLADPHRCRRTMTISVLAE